MKEAGLGIRAVAPVVAWSSVSPWRLLTPVVYIDLLWWVKEGVEGLCPAKKVNDDELAFPNLHRLFSGTLEWKSGFRHPYSQTGHHRGKPAA